MKKIWTIVALLMVAVAAVCVVVHAIEVNYVPKDALTIDELFSGNKRVLNDFKVTAWHPGYLTVELNGKEYNLTDQDKMDRLDSRYRLDSQVTEGSNYASFSDMNNFIQSEPLLDKFFWTDKFDSKIGKEYYAIWDTTGSIQKMVIMAKDSMPTVVDASKWNNTHATLTSAVYPESHFYFVYNQTTQEMAVFHYAKAVDENGKEYWLKQGFGPIWGNITVPDGYVQYEDLEVGYFLLINEK